MCSVFDPFGVAAHLLSLPRVPRQKRRSTRGYSQWSLPGPQSAVCCAHTRCLAVDAPVSHCSIGRSKLRLWRIATMQSGSKLPQSKLHNHLWKTNLAELIS
jgi:hypothetical protein